MPKTNRSNIQVMRKNSPQQWRQQGSVKQPFVENFENRVSRNKKNWTAVVPEATGKKTKTRDTEDSWMQHLQEALSMGRIWWK